jgi:hypothetical protein
LRDREEIIASKACNKRRFMASFVLFILVTTAGSLTFFEQSFCEQD